MSFSFTFRFDEISVKIDGRDKSVDGSVEIYVNTTPRGRHLEEVYTWGLMTISRMFDWETETDHPVAFNLTSDLKSYQLIDEMIFELYEREALSLMGEDA